MYVDSKSPLIDLEECYDSTGRKQDNSGQRERLSEENFMYIVYWIRLEEHTNLLEQGYIGITKNLKERLRAHKKNKKQTHFYNAIQKYGYSNLIVDILHENLTLEQALLIEYKLRPSQKIGWNSQMGGHLGVESAWYSVEEHRQKHSKATSEATKLGIANLDTSEDRALRAKKSWVENKDSYSEMSLGSKNPRAILNEMQVREIKYNLLPNNIPIKDIAKTYNVKPYVIQFIKYGKNWKHI